MFVAGEHTFDDEGSAERQIQSVFDFLEEAEDLDRGCEYWGANPRHSLNVDDEEEMGNVEPKGESSDDDVLMFTFTFPFPSFSESFVQHRPRVGGRAQLYRLSLVDAHTVAQNQYTVKKFDNIHFFCHGIVLCAKV